MHTDISKIIYICYSTVSEIHVIILFSSFLSFQFLIWSPCHASVRAFQYDFLFLLSVLLLAARSRFNYFLGSQILITCPFLSFLLQFLFFLPMFISWLPKHLSPFTVLQALFPCHLPQPITLYRLLPITSYYYTQLHIYLRL